MYLPNYWTKLMLLSYLLVWLWSWYFWYFPLESENMRSALVRFLPCLSFSFCASRVSSLALKKYQACAKKQNVWKSVCCRLPNIKRSQNSKWSCISQWMLGPGLPGCAQCGSSPSQTSLFKARKEIPERFQHLWQNQKSHLSCLFHRNWFS